MPDLATDIGTARAAAKAELAAIRFAHETGGLDVYLDDPVAPPVGTYHFATDRETYVMIVGAIQRHAHAAYSFIDWKLRNGTFLRMTFSAFSNMGVAVGKHVQWCFTAESDVIAQIDAASDVSGMDLQALYDAAYAAAKSA